MDKTRNEILKRENIVTRVYLIKYLTHKALVAWRPNGDKSLQNE
jgi:hypothetical protein